MILNELDLVTLLATCIVDGDNGPLSMPTGSAGTIVHVYAGQNAFEVEFYKPFHAVATIAAELLGPPA